MSEGAETAKFITLRRQPASKYGNQVNQEVKFSSHLTDRFSYPP